MSEKRRVRIGEATRATSGGVAGGQDERRNAAAEVARVVRLDLWRSVKGGVVEDKETLASTWPC